MFDIGFIEMLVIAVVGLIVIGPARLPSAIRSAFKTLSTVKQYFSTMQSEFEKELNIDEVREQMAELKKSEPIADIEASLDTMNEHILEAERQIRAKQNAAEQIELQDKTDNKE